MPMSPRLLRPRSTVHPEAASWAQRVRDNGGSVSGSTLAAVGRFCASIDAAGIRSKFVRVNLFCGMGGNLNAVLVPLYRNTSPSGAVIGSAIDVNSGASGALFLTTDYTERGSSGGLIGTSANRFLNTGVATNTMSEGNRHISAYEVTRSGATFDRFLGSESSASVSQVLSLGYGNNASQVVFPFSAFSGGVNGTTTTTGGHWIGSNASAGSGVLYKNGAQDATSSQTAATPPASELFVFAVNRASASATPALAAADFYGGRLGGYSIGLGLSAAEALSYYNAMQAFQTAMQRNV